MHTRAIVNAEGSIKLREILEKHPFVDIEGFRDAARNKAAFRQSEGERQVFQRRPGADILYGLPELMDNNPLVCAAEAACPGPAATLALIAAGPLARAGLLRERPAFAFSFDENFSEAEHALETCGWHEGAICAGSPADLGTCLSVGCLAEIVFPGEAELESLFEEAYGRSFFVRRHKDATWSPDLVAGEPFALYRWQTSPAEGGAAVLRVDVIADIEGKCGAAQLVHMLNIMACFEEDTGIFSHRSAATQA